MIKPYSNLPFWSKLSRNKYKIYDQKDTLIINDVLTTMQDKEYIIEACNNYPKAIEFLKNMAPQPNSPVYNFLKEINAI